MMIETLESRQFLSATLLATPTAPPAVQPNAGSQQRLVVVVGSGDTTNLPKPNVVIAIIAVLIGL
jgi:hypothetical protein